jgi:hypothetical protein
MTKVGEANQVAVRAVANQADSLAKIGKAAAKKQVAAVVRKVAVVRRVAAVREAAGVAAARAAATDKR